LPVYIIEGDFMKTRKVSVCALALSFAAFAGGAYAQDSAEAVKGFYIGGAAGQARFDDDFEIDDLDREDTSWKAIAGWRFADQFALEASYIDFGDSTAPAALGLTPFAQEAKAFSLQAVGYIPIPYVDLFAKVGAARIDAEGGGGALARVNDKSTNFAYGWGVQWRWQSLAVRAEYERFDTDLIGDLDLASVGVTYTFPVQR
jgi:OOP family OmpA-OmpF porin